MTGFGAEQKHVTFAPRPSDGRVCPEPDLHELSDDRQRRVSGVQPTDCRNARPYRLAVGPMC
jgi:hypothetical protein